MLARFIGLLSLGVSAVLAGSVSTGLVERNTPDVKSLLAQPQNKWCKGTQVFFPGMANYANLTTQRWTSFEAPSYVASIKPSCADDVAKVVSSPLLGLRSPRYSIQVSNAALCSLDPPL